MNQIEINLSKRYNDKLGIGPIAKKIFLEANRYDEAIMNFEGIDFMSRSFAQEYVSQKFNSQSKIIEINMKDNIAGVLDLISEEFEPPRPFRGRGFANLNTYKCFRVFYCTVVPTVISNPFLRIFFEAFTSRS